MSNYSVYVTPDALNEIKSSPGNMRQRIKRAIDDLANDPRPHDSKVLTIDNSNDDIEVRRIRLEKWRILYAITEVDKVVDVWRFGNARPMTTVI